MTNATIDFDTSMQRIPCHKGMDLMLSAVPDTVHHTSHLLQPQNDTSPALTARKSISITNVWIGFTGAGTIVLAAKAGLDMYDNIAAKIAKKSKDNSCTLTYGTDSDDGYYMGYAYYAATTGKNCDTTAIKETVHNAVSKCADRLHDAGTVRGCCAFSHGGTWSGHLQLTADPVKYPATSVTC